MSELIIIGVDGGGTRTSLVAVTEDGTVLGRGYGKGINYNAIGLEAARNNLNEAVYHLLGEINEREYSVLAIGMSALDQAATENEIRAFAGEVFDPDKLHMDSDVYMALIAATGGRPGVMVVSGTGSMVVARNERGEIITRGGWGYRLDDPGSAYGIAIDSIKAALRYKECGGAGTALADEAQKFFRADSMREVIRVIHENDCPPSMIAGFATQVIGLADSGDEVARAQVVNHMKHLADMTNGILQEFDRVPTVSLYGGMFEHNPWVCEILKAQLFTQQNGLKIDLLTTPPELGAVIDYMQSKGLLTETFIRKLQKTWEERKQ